MTDKPAPLVPAEVDLRDFQFMPVDIGRLLKSETWGLGDGEQKAAAITLWFESWHQVPAGSLPSNDRMLAKLSQSDRWPKARDHALRGWVECSDGRLYHAVVCEKALEAWLEKLASGITGASGNAKRWGVEVDTSRLRAMFREAVEYLKRIAPQSKALKKKVVAVVLAGSAPISGGESGAESGGDHDPISAPDRNRQGQREGIDNPPAPKGGGKGEGRFPDFWAAWPAESSRKTDRKKCLAKWQRHGWDSEADAIVAHVVAMKATRQWRDGYEPAPLTYLNGERWRDGIPRDARTASADIFAGAE